jgi:signal transduction histidine kinase
MRTGRLPARLARAWSGRATVAVGLLAFVVAVYVVVVLVGGALIGRTESPSVALSVLATVIVALLLAPVQVALERAVARAGHPQAASPYDVLKRFSQDVGGAGPTSELPDRMAALLGQGTGAQWAQVWLVVSGRLVLAGTWPVNASPDTGPPPQELGNVQAEELHGRRSLSVSHGGQVLGVLRLQERPDVALTAIEERLFAGVAGQAGQVLRRVALQASLEEQHAELTARAGDLQASRQRLVDAQDAERRRLERDMHDGAQQHLVALAVNLRLAQALALHSPQRAADLLGTQAHAAEITMSTLSSLSRGIYPRLLTEAGLVVALRSALATASIPVTVVPRLVTQRLSAPVEAALYFCALEAVQNASKHSGASRVTVALEEHTDSFVLSVADDGVGFDSEHALQQTSAGGLLNMSDRLGAIGGVVDILSGSRTGTMVMARVPHLPSGSQPAQDPVDQVVSS